MLEKEGCHVQFWQNGMRRIVCVFATERSGHLKRICAIDLVHNSFDGYLNVQPDIYMSGQEIQVIGQNRGQLDA